MPSNEMLDIFEINRLRDLVEQLTVDRDDYKTSATLLAEESLMYRQRAEQAEQERDAALADRQRALDLARRSEQRLADAEKRAGLAEKAFNSIIGQLDERGRQCRLLGCPNVPQNPDLTVERTDCGFRFGEDDRVK